MDNYKIKYRPEIDGLRAIGVISVLIYHANINFFGFNLNGGFLGVDIFFEVIGRFFVLFTFLSKSLSTISLTIQPALRIKTEPKKNKIR